MREARELEAAERKPGRRERVRYAKGRFAQLAQMLGVAGVPSAPPRDRNWALLRLDRMLSRIASFGSRPVVAMLRFRDDTPPELIEECGELLDLGVRTRDWIARWDERSYLLVLDARIDHAIAAMERLRDRVVALFDENGVHDGLMIGIALSRRDETALDVTERASRSVVDTQH